jgi:hypothetical protein
VIDLMSAAGLLGLGRLIKVPTAPLRDLLAGSAPVESPLTVAPGE